MKNYAALMSIFIALALAGCGTGNGGSAGKVTIASTSIATFPGHNSGGTGPLTSTGGDVETSVTFGSSSTIVAHSVLLNVADTSGKSLFGGPQNMGQMAVGNRIADPNNFHYSFTIPANTTNQAQIYTFTVTATDTAGHTINPPANIGTVTVPGS